MLFIGLLESGFRYRALQDTIYRLYFGSILAFGHGVLYRIYLKRRVVLGLGIILRAAPVLGVGVARHGTLGLAVCGLGLHEFRGSRKSLKVASNF